MATSEWNRRGGVGAESETQVLELVDISCTSVVCRMLSVVGWAAVQVPQRRPAEQEMAERECPHARITEFKSAWSIICDNSIP